MTGLVEVSNLFLGLLALVANVDCSGMTVTLDSFIHIEQVNRLCEFAKLAKSVVTRIKLWGLLSDITAHSTQMRPPGLVGSRIKGVSKKRYQFGISFQLVCRFRFNGRLGIFLEPIASGIVQPLHENSAPLV